MLELSSSLDMPALMLCTALFTNIKIMIFLKIENSSFALVPHRRDLGSLKSAQEVPVCSKI